MSDVSNGEPERVDARGGWGKSRKGWAGQWGHLPAEKREQYERIEARVREKMRRGEL